MNTYDPADRIVYVHMAGTADARLSPVDGGTTCTPLPSDYANQSPQTRLQRRPAPVRRNRTGVASLTA